MRSSTRRRVDVALVALGVVLVGTAAAVGALAGDTERAAAVWAGAQVAEDGSARIVEVIDFDFGAERHHGITRDVPDLPPDAPVDAHSPTAPDQVVVTPGTFGGSEIRIGDPNRKVSGRHRYTIDYPLDTLTSGDRVAWNVVGTTWREPVGDVEVHLVSPFRLDELRCFRGKAGSRQPCSVRQVEPGHLVARVDGLGKGRGVTVEAVSAGRIGDAPTLPAPPSGRADDPGTGVVPPLVLAVIAALAGAIPTSVLIQRAGRERVAVGGAAAAAWGGDAGGEAYVMRDSDDLAALATVEFAPPEDLSPAQGGVLLTESVSPDHKTAWLVQAAVDGYVELEEDTSGVTLVRGDRRDGSTSAILDQAFAGRDRLPLGKYDSSFAGAWTAVGEELSKWAQASGLWDPAGDRRKVRAQLIGAGVFTLGLVGTALAAWPANVHGPRWLALVAVGAVVAGGGWTAVVRSWELRVRSARGSGLWLRVESFRRFLAESEGRHAEEAAKRGVLREYTAWAVAVGEVDRWSRAVQTAGVAVADPSAMR